jgi:uncharacterized glyoxalase superfamily protein PhnB
VHAITPHIVVRGASEAARWYVRALGAEERSRVPLPDGRLLSIELHFGDSTVMLADEFPEPDVLSPETIGGTAVVLHLMSDDVDALWQRALEAGAGPCTRSRTSSGATGRDRSPIRSVTAGISPSRCARSPPRGLPAPPQPRSVDEQIYEGLGGLDTRLCASPARSARPCFRDDQALSFGVIRPWISRAE